MVFGTRQLEKSSVHVEREIRKQNGTMYGERHVYRIHEGSKANYRFISHNQPFFRVTPRESPSPPMFMVRSHVAELPPRLQLAKSNTSLGRSPRDRMRQGLPSFGLGCPNFLSYLGPATHNEHFVSLIRVLI